MYAHVLIVSAVSYVIVKLTVSSATVTK